VFRDGHRWQRRYDGQTKHKAQKPMQHTFNCETCSERTIPRQLLNSGLLRKKTSEAEARTRMESNHRTRHNVSAFHCWLKLTNHVGNAASAMIYWRPALWTSFQKTLIMAQKEQGGDGYTTEEGNILKDTLLLSADKGSSNLPIAINETPKKKQQPTLDPHLRSDRCRGGGMGQGPGDNARWSSTFMLNTMFKTNRQIVVFAN
jgi:hypothetical protein